MATGVAAVSPTIQNFSQQQIFNAKVGSIGDTTAKDMIAAIGITNPIPNNTLQGHGEGIYADILA